MHAIRSARLSSWLIAGALLGVLPAPVFAQSTATILGVVQDPNGAVVPGAKVSIRQEATGLVRDTVSAGNGDYTITNLAIGDYTLTVAYQGFKTSVLRGIVLQVGQQARVNVTLTVGQLNETVTVTETVPLVATDSSSVGQVVENRSIQSLALNGRQFWQLVALVPGATYIQGGQSTQTGGTSIRSSVVNVQINGSGRIFNGWLLDGADVTEYEAGGTMVQPNVDALQEFKVESSNLTADFGHTPNAISATIKSGTNEFHGSVFEFLRNDKVDARNFFAKTKNGLRRNQFGYTLGGPVRKDKLFLFTDIESTRLRQEAVFASVVPSTAMRTGDFSELKTALKDPLTGLPLPGNIVPQSRISPQSQFFLKYMPPASAANFNAPTTLDSYKGDVKGDYQLSTSDHLMGRYSIGDNDENDPNPFPALGGFPLHSRAQSATLSETHIFSPNWLNEARFSYYRSIFVFGQALAGTNFDAMAGVKGFEVTQTLPSFPLINITGYQQFQGSGYDNRPKSNRIRNWQYSDTVSYTVGRHDMKMGAQMYHQTHAFIIAGGQEGKFSFLNTYTGNGFGDFMFGYPDNVFRPYAQNLFGNYANQWAGFWSDNFKASRRLTINIGLRFEHNPYYNGIRGQTSAFDYQSGKLILPMRNGKLLDDTAQPQIATLYPLFKDRFIGTDTLGLPESIRPSGFGQWAPRIGLAWRPTGSDRFVVRAGYGIFYVFLDTNITLQWMKVPPFQAAQTVFNNRPTPNRTFGDFFLGEPIVAPNQNPGQPCPFGFAALSCGTPDLQSTNTYLKPNYIQQWNFATQFQIRKDLALDVAYVGNKTVRAQLNNMQRNNPLPGAGNIQSRRPYPQWGLLNNGELVGSNNYNSLQVKVEKRFAHGVQMLATYTNSKCIDQGTDENGPPDARLLAVNRATCDFNISQSGVVSAVYELPFGKGRTFLSGAGRLSDAVLGGWEMAGVLTLQAGLPFTPTIAGDRANTGASNQRPNRLGSGSLAAPTPTLWFNPADFAVPTQYTYGNSGRNILNCDGLKQFDMTLLKRFQMGEKRRLEFRSEFFNLSNHPTFAAPVPQIDSTTAGRITSTRNAARILQFALKFQF